MALLRINANSTKGGINDPQIIRAILGDDSKKRSVEYLSKYAGFIVRCIGLHVGEAGTIPWDIGPMDEGADRIWGSGTDFPTLPPDEIEWLGELPVLIGKWYASLLSSGQAYSLKEVSRGEPTGLPYLAPGTITKIDYSGFKPTVFHRNENGVERRYGADDVFHVFAPHHLVEAGAGWSAGHASRVSASASLALMEFTERFLNGDLIKSTAVIAKNNRLGMDHPIIQGLRQQVRKLIKRSPEEDPPIFGADVDIRTIGDGLSDLKTDELDRTHKADTAAAFGIPLILLDPRTDGRGSMRGAQEQFLTGTVFRWVRLLESALNIQVLRPVGLSLRFRYREHPLLQTRMTEQAIGLQTLSGGKPIMHAEEARRILGLPEDDYFSIEAEEARRQEQAAQFDGPSLGKQEEEEMKAWRRKVSKKGRHAHFEAKHIRPVIVDMIKARLQTAMPLDLVFSGPFKGF